VEISELKREDEKEWDSYINSSPCSTFYHRIGWKTVLSEIYSHQPLYLVAKNDDKISGIFPLFKIKYPIFGNILVSLPYAPFGGVCADDEQTGRQLLDAAKNHLRQNNYRSLEVRSLYEFPDAGSIDTSYYSMVLPLRNNFEDQWSGLRKSMRRYVKKAQSVKFEVNLNSHNITGFYNLYSQAMRDFGTPAHSNRFFNMLLQEFPDSTRIAEVEYEGECIAAIFLLEFNGTMIYGWGASDERYTMLYPNYSLFWDVILDGGSRHLRSFDFGRSMLNEGTYLFKTGWGAEPRQLYYFYCPQRSVNTKKNNPKRKIFSGIWRHLPKSVGLKLGPALRKYIP